jgi:hypothetical protein
MIGTNRAVPMVPGDDVVLACPFVVRKGRQIVAAFATRSDACNWVKEISDFKDTESTYIVHTAAEIIAGYRNGSQVEVP